MTRGAGRSQGGQFDTRGRLFVLEGSLGHPIDATEGPDGAVYVLDFDGRVLRLEHLTPCGAEPTTRGDGGGAS